MIKALVSFKQISLGCETLSLRQYGETYVNLMLNVFKCHLCFGPIHRCTCVLITHVDTVDVLIPEVQLSDIYAQNEN